MMRLSRDYAIMETAKVFARRSTCTRGQVGAVIAREGRVLATGYNGAPASMPHCNHDCTCSPFDQPTLLDKGHTIGCPLISECTIAVHAEANAIAFSAKHGIATVGTELFTTMAPCPSCAKLIINAGISTVYYNQLYRITEGIDLLNNAGVDAVVMK